MRWLFLALPLVLAPATARAAGCPYPATSDPAPFDRADVIDDELTTSDAVQTGQLAVSPTAPAPTCAAPDSAPAVAEPDSQFHYRAYPFHNYTGASACVSVTVYHAGQGQSLQVAAYSPSFDPTSVASHYLAAAHSDALSVYQFSFTVAPNADFEVVLDSANASGTYQLLVGGCGEPGIDAGTSSSTGAVTTDVSGTDPAPAPSAGSSSATPPQTGGHTNGALPANESFGDCSAAHGSPRDAVFIALAIALSVARRRRRAQST